MQRIRRIAPALGTLLAQEKNTAFCSCRGEIAPQGAIRGISCIREIRVPTLNLDARPERQSAKELRGATKRLPVSWLTSEPRCSRASLEHLEHLEHLCLSPFPRIEHHLIHRHPRPD